MNSCSPEASNPVDKIRKKETIRNNVRSKVKRESLCADEKLSKINAKQREEKLESQSYGRNNVEEVSITVNSCSCDQNDDWEKLFDEGTVGLAEDENCIDNLNQFVENIHISSTNQPESDGTSIIEIFGFPEEFKTQDLMKAFTTFVNRGFKLKWVDDTHALGIFPAPSIADEALAAQLPFVKTRPLSQASDASKSKAKDIVLPSEMRPKTCTSMAKRLVSSALGIKNIVSPAEREAERQILREAKEQKKIAAKQREAAWEGRF